MEAARAPPALEEKGAQRVLSVHLAYPDLKGFKVPRAQSVSLEVLGHRVRRVWTDYLVALEGRVDQDCLDRKVTPESRVNPGCLEFRVLGAAKENRVWTAYQDLLERLETPGFPVSTPCQEGKGTQDLPVPRGYQENVVRKVTVASQGFPPEAGIGARKGSPAKLEFREYPVWLDPLVRQDPRGR